jgi:hypothetical protein
VFVSLVPQTEDDVFEAFEFMFAIAKLERRVGQVLHELDCIIGGFALSIGSHDEEDTTILWDLIKILKIVFLGVADQRSKAELGLCLLSNANGIFLGSTSL